MKQEKGFTFIEFLVVILLLGIIAALSLPKFMNLGAQSRQSNNRAMAGSLLSAINAAHSQWVAAGNKPANITFNGNTISMNSTAADPGFGFPCLANGSGCSSATVATAASCAALFPMLVQGGPEVQAGASACTSPDCYVASGSTSICTYARKDASDVKVDYDYKLATVLSTPQ